jgi:hypothetical protein
MIVMISRRRMQHHLREWDLVALYITLLIVVLLWATHVWSPPV